MHLVFTVGVSTRAEVMVRLIVKGILCFWSSATQISFNNMVRKLWLNGPQYDKKPVSWSTSPTSLKKRYVKTFSLLVTVIFDMRTFLYNLPVYLRHKFCALFYPASFLSTKTIYKCRGNVHFIFTHLSIIYQNLKTKDSCHQLLQGCSKMNTETFQLG